MTQLDEAGRPLGLAPAEDDGLQGLEGGKEPVEVNEPPKDVVPGGRPDSPVRPLYVPGDYVPRGGQAPGRPDSSVEAEESLSCLVRIVARHEAAPNRPGAWRLEQEEAPGLDPAVERIEVGDAVLRGDEVRRLYFGAQGTHEVGQNRHVRLVQEVQTCPLFWPHQRLRRVGR